MKPGDIFLALIVVLIWGANFSVVKIGLAELPPIFFSALRFSIIAIPGVFLFSFPKTSVINVVGVGLFLGVCKFGLLFVAMYADASAGMASLLLQSQVFFTILLSVVFFKERVSLVQGIGILIAAAGFFVIAIDLSGSTTELGLTLLLFAGLSWGVSNLFMKRTKNVDLLGFMVWISLIPPIPLFILSYYLEGPNPIVIVMQASGSTWFSLAFVSYVTTVLGFGIWGRLLSKYPAVAVAPFALLIPIAGITVSYIILDERLSSSEVVGAVLMLLGLMVCVIRFKIRPELLRSKTGSNDA